MRGLCLRQLPVLSLATVAWAGAVGSPSHPRTDGLVALFKVGHDPRWRHYVVCFEGSRTCMLTMTNSSKGEDIQDALLRNVLADAFTPVEWQGFQPLRDMARYER